MFNQVTTERLLLKQILAEDQQFIFEGLSHPEVIPFYGVRYASFEETKQQLDWYEKMLQEDTGIPWKMVNRVTGENIGVISVYSYQKQHNKAEVGFWLLPQYWNKGIAVEALRAVLDYWKRERNLHRLEAFVEEGNEASSRLLEKAGFLYEGKMRDCEIKNGRYISLKVYGLIL